MKPTVVADEMFPEGAGPFMELDEVNQPFFVSILFANQKTNADDH